MPSSRASSTRAVSSRSDRSTARLASPAWPSAHGGSMHIQGGTAIAYKREIEAAEDPEAKRVEIEARLFAISSPFRNAHAFGVEEIIDPRDTRPLLVDFMRDARRVVKAELLGPATGPSYRP
ncbi:MAG: hypothetical protein OXH70_05705 [Acidobacteria bacterium]|nr:hypothetical protein [Acidobacteriota bacterium]